MKADTRGFVIFTTVGCIAAGGVGYAVWQSTSPDAQKASDRSSIPSTTSSSSTKTTSSSSDIPAPPTAVASPLMGDPLLPPNAFVPRDTPEVAPTKLYRPQAQASRNFAEPNPLNAPGAPGPVRGGTTPRNNNPDNNPANPGQPNTGGGNTHRRPDTQERGDNNVPAPSLAGPSTNTRPTPGSGNDNFIEEEGPSTGNSGNDTSSQEPSAIPSRPHSPNQLPGQHLPSYPSPQGNGQQSGQSPDTASNTPTPSDLTSGEHTSTGQQKTREFNGMGGPDVPIDASGSNTSGTQQSSDNTAETATQNEQPTQQGSTGTQSQQSEQAAPSSYSPADQAAASENNTTTVHGQDSMPNATSFSTTYSAEPTDSASTE